MRYKLLQFWQLATRIWIKQPMLKTLRLNLLPNYILVLQTTLTRAKQADLTILSIEL
jgi:hypothetical protein